MDDRNIMEDLIQLEKGVSELYVHGSLEASSNDVHAVFKNALEESLKMQHDIYKQMEQKGWYQTQQVEQQKISQLKQKYSQNSMS